MRRPFTVLFALLLFAAGCSSKEVPNDFQIVAEIKARLAALDINTATSINVQSDNGAVILAGTVTDAKDKERFRRVAHLVTGVRYVTLKLAVNPHMPTATSEARNFSLAASVLANMTAHAGIDAFSVKPAVKNGIVTLSGNVHSTAVKVHLLDLARHTAGVRGVVDRIRVTK